MNRRESLALLVVAAAAPALPALARTPVPTVVIYDGRYREARDFAADADLQLDCKVDAALLWYSSGLTTARHIHVVGGITTATDALVIADCASRSGMRFARVAHAIPESSLVCWTLTRPFAPHQPA
jgi:hypothetical protein